MAIRAKLLSVPLNTATGNQVITGVGFQPEVAIGMIMDVTGAGAAAGQNFCMFGMMSATASVSIGMAFEDGVVSDGGAGNNYNNNPAFRMVDADSVVKAAGTFVTFGSDGVTINITTAPPTAYQMYLLFLQDDTAAVIQSSMGRFACNTTIGTQDVTGIGFAPDVVIFLQGFNSTTTASGGIGTGNLSPLGTVGFATSSAAQCCAYVAEIYGANPSNTKRGYRSDRCAHQQGGTTNYLSVQYVKALADGFQIDIKTTSGSAWVLGYIALKGIGAKVVTEISTTTTGTHAITGAGFQPSAIIGVTSGVQVDATDVDDARFCVGMATGASAGQRVNMAMGSLDNILGSTSTSEKLATTFLTDLTANHGTPVDNNVWDVSAIGSDGFTYNHTVADGAAVRLGLLMLGASSAGNQTITLTGIASAQAPGTPTIFTGSSAQTITLTGIASQAAVGVPVVGGAKVIQPVGIKGSDYQDVEVTGAFDDVAFDPSFTQYRVELLTGPDPRSALVQFGTSTQLFLEVAPGTYTDRWSLTNASNTVLSNTQADTIIVGNIGFPTIVVGGGGGAAIVVPVGIPSAASFGNLTIVMAVLPTGIASAAAVGTPTIVTGGLAVLPTGIPSQAAVGNPTMQSDQLVFVVGIPSGEDFGTVQVGFEGGQILNISGIETSEQFGTVVMSIPVAPTPWPVIPDPDTVWTRIPPGREG